MDLLTISKQYANVRAGLPSSANIIPGSTTTFGGNLSVNGSLTGQNLLIGTSTTSQCAISNAGFLQMTGSTSGTMLTLANVISAPYTIFTSTFTSQIEYAAIGVTVGSSLDMYAYNSHNWNLTSTGSDPGFSAMQLSNYGLGVYLQGQPQATLHVGETAQIDGYGFYQSGPAALHLGGPLTILNGSNDYYRFISALDNSMSSSSRYMNIGQSTSTGNSLEIEFRFDSSNAPTNAFKFGFPGNGVMTLLNSGNVGILTSSPTATLDVAGAGHFSGSLTVGGSLTTPSLVLSGTTSGTVLQLMNSTSGTTTTAYAALGVTPGTALENFALTSHRWWTGSSGTASGTVRMQLTSGSLSVSGSLTANSVNGLTRLVPAFYTYNIAGPFQSSTVAGNITLSGGVQLWQVNLSGYTSSSTAFLWYFQVNSTIVAQQSTSINTSTSHMLFNPISFTTSYTAGTYSFGGYPNASAAISDGNDRLVVTVIEHQ